MQVLEILVCLEERKEREVNVKGKGNSSVSLVLRVSAERRRASMRPRSHIPANIL